jgi:hypothetical protein
MEKPKKAAEMEVSSVRTERRCSRRCLYRNFLLSGRHLAA